jgi:hypothetical protein
MSVEEEKERIFHGFLEGARKRWGEEEARILEPALKRTAEAIWKVENVELGIGEEPGNPPRREG